MKAIFTPLIIALLLWSPSVFAQNAAIEVERVDFKKTGDDWVQMEIQLSCQGNPSADARDPRYVENIKVKAYLAYERDKKARLYDYYTSELEIIIMEKGDDNNVYFYLPGLIVERDQLATDPDFYYVEVSVNGQAQQPQKEAMSSDIANLDILTSFTTRADGEAGATKHILMPIYLVSGVEFRGVSDLPAFLRRDVSSDE